MIKDEFKNRTLGYLQLFRLQTTATTALTPVIGALVLGQKDIFHLFILFIIGCFYHIYGFVLNEYIDIDVDKKSKDLQKYHPDLYNELKLFYQQDPAQLDSRAGGRM